MENFEPLTNGSFFSGLGGLDEGAKRAGIETLYLCENNRENWQFLEKHYPGVPIYEDITKIEAHELPKTGIISGGFPCQDISRANPKGQGLKGKRSALYFEMFRMYSHHRPHYVVIENVSALTVRGLQTILADFAQIGYVVEWRDLRVSDFGGPHKRERIFLIAYPHQKRCQYSVFIDLEHANITNKAWQVSEGFKQWNQWQHWFTQVIPHSNWKRAHGEFLRMDDGIPTGLLKAQIEGFGNAVSPVVAEYIYTCIQVHYLITNGIV